MTRLAPVREAQITLFFFFFFSFFLDAGRTHPSGVSASLVESPVTTTSFEEDWYELNSTEGCDRGCAEEVADARGANRRRQSRHNDLASTRGTKGSRSKPQNQHILERRRRSNGMMVPANISVPNNGLLARNGPVAAVVNVYLRQCTLAIFYEEGLDLYALQLRKSIAHLPVKIYLITPETLLREDSWKMNQCDGYIVLLSKGATFIQHAATDHYFNTPYDGPDDHPPHYWNYRAKFVIVLVSDNNVPLPVDIASLYNFKKTENLLILQKSGAHVLVWTNILYSEHSVITLADTWRGGAFIRGTELFPNKLKNLKGAIIKVGTFEHAPSVTYQRDADGQILKRMGVDMGVVLALAQAKTFRIEFVEVSSSEKWGTKYRNGTWDGLMNKVLYEHVDIGICNVFTDHFRWMEVDFSYPYNFMPACFVAPSPKPVINWQSPLLPFAWDTWISIGISLLVCGALVYLVASFSHSPEARDFQSLSYNYLYIVGAFTVHPLTLGPRFPPSRLLLGFIWLFSLIISTGYSANLVAFLSVVRMSQPIDTIEQLVSSGLRIGGHSFWKTQFSAAPEQAVLDLVDKLESDVDFFTVFNDVEKGKFGFVENQEFLQLQQGSRFTYGGIATIRLGRQCLINFNIAMILPRKSPLTNSFNTDLLRIYESGIMKKWQEEVVVFFRQQYLSKLLRAPSDSRSKPIGLGQLQGIFYFVGISSVLGFFILIAENIMKTTPSGPSP
ncbi:ionotropic receptor 21a-like [Macrobrachium nipponense]|uniref:ionotropic receptor 21a-like n=1 Tax=Macrobrachium nipponense TaxID=159736 RepID=UPI0030C808E5